MITTIIDVYPTLTMAIIELIFPRVKTDPATLETLEKDWPTLSKGLTHPNPGLLHAFRGWVLTEDGKDVRERHHEFLLFEWNAANSFHDFVGSEQFAAFASSVRPLVTGPPTLQLFETSFSPKDAASAPVVQIIRTQVSSLEDAAASLQVWKKMYSLLVSEGGGRACATFGTSLNLEETTIVGIIGWLNLEDHNRASWDGDFLNYLNTLKSFGRVSSITVDIDAMEM
ncbi:hypothetical protein N7526_000321 [Penicillium atrosanguineum]|nr:hypothetical protein N7526_000321 [Penicillium atrosanguineum]